MKRRTEVQFCPLKKSRFSSLVILLSMNFSASISMEINLELQIMPFCLPRVVFSHRSKQTSFFQISYWFVIHNCFASSTNERISANLYISPIFLPRVPSKPLFVVSVFFKNAQAHCKRSQLSKFSVLFPIRSLWKINCNVE